MYWYIQVHRTNPWILPFHPRHLLEDTYPYWLLPAETSSFPGNENPTSTNFRSNNSVSVGPTVRSYARHVSKLRTFFITEFREPGAPWSPVNKKVNLFPWNSQIFSMEFDKTFHGIRKDFPWNATLIFHGIWHLFSMDIDITFHGVQISFPGNAGECGK